MALTNLDLPETVSTNTWNGTGVLQILTDNGNPINLTDCLIEMKVRLSFDSPSVLYFSTTDETIGIVNPNTLGKFFIEPRIIDIPPGLYQYDIKVTFPSGDVRTYYSGTWNILPCITR